MTIQHKINTDTHKRKFIPLTFLELKKLVLLNGLMNIISIIGKEYEMIYSNIVDTYIETFCANENDD